MTHYVGEKACAAVETAQGRWSRQYQMVGKTYVPEFNDSIAPRFFTECLDATNIPYQVFR